MPRSRAVLGALLLAGCAALPGAPGEAEGPLAGLPATFENTPACEACLALTLTLRSGGTYLVRARQGSAEFSDFGRWRAAGDALELQSRREPLRRYALQAPDTLAPQAATPGGALKRKPAVENLRGPFRLYGFYIPGEGGASFRDCLSEVTWPVAASRAAEALEKAYRAAGREGPALASVDGHFEERPGQAGEQLVLQREPELLKAERCPSD